MICLKLNNFFTIRVEYCNYCKLLDFRDDCKKRILLFSHVHDYPQLWNCVFLCLTITSAISRLLDFKLSAVSSYLDVTKTYSVNNPNADLIQLIVALFWKR